MKISCSLLGLIAVFGTLPSGVSGNQLRPQPRTLEEVPCPSMPAVTPERMALIVERKPHITKTPPASEADRVSYMEWSKIDPSGICRYRRENSSLPPPTERRVIFIGDLITESWKPAMPSFFIGERLDRGVSGQTTTQMLARFRTDVIDLHPAVVHIMGGINDVATPAGTALTRSNIESMVELARAHGITGCCQSNTNRSP